MNSNPPFAVGQKVVCLVSGGKGLPQKGDIFIVLGVRKHCCVWLIDIGITSPVSFSATCRHGNKIAIKSGEPLWPEATVFAPIEYQHEDITEKIAQSATQTEERPDKVVIPETVNN